MGNVLITGGTGGIGKALKKKFLAEGHTVMCPTRNELDLNSVASIDNYFDKLNHSIDILINNAGINNLEQIIDISYSSLLHTFQVNCFAPFLISQKCIEKYFLKNSSGSIVNIASIWINYTKTGRSAYSMSKSALNALTKSIAVEYGPNNIRCNTVSPGFVETELTHKNNSTEEIVEITNRVPLKRLSQPEEIADLVYYISVLNQFINGENIFIDGGVTKRF
jgi:3-oxoacyl-[acyl-carrier protein] reductase